MRAMILHPDDMQPLVVRDRKDDIKAFGIIYVNREQGYAIVNDFEVNRQHEGKDDDREQIYKTGVKGVEAFVEQYNQENDIPIRVVTSGLSPNWTAVNDFVKKNPDASMILCLERLTRKELRLRQTLTISNMLLAMAIGVVIGIKVNGC